MSNIIIVKKSSGAVIRITNAAADILESMLNEVPAGNISICKLASNLIEYAAKDTVIKVEE